MMAGEPLPLPLGGLEREDLTVLFFRVAFDLGAAVEAHRDDLVSSLEDEGLYAFLSKRSQSWIDLHVDRLAYRGTYADHLNIVRENILAERAGSPEDRMLVYEQIANKLRPRAPRELADELKDLSDEAYACVGRAISEHGGKGSAARWSQCRSASLAFRHGEKGPTRTIFERADRDQITVLIGNRAERTGASSALRTYFNMLFYFLHEYVSHSFAKWQETQFVEGYLVWAASAILYYDRRDKLRQSYVKKTFFHEPEDFGKLDDLYESHEVSDWFSRTVGEARFLRFLLEWAADEHYVDESGADLKALHRLSESCTKGRRLINDIKAAFDEADCVATRERLRELAAPKGVPVPYQSPL